MNIKSRRRKLTVTILSLSLLTVMAGAAVAPALDVIKNSFPNTSQTLIQMIISIPALFIFLTNMIFPRLCKIFRAKELAVSALILYAFGGCAAGLFSNIYVILMFRAVVGIGVGIIMPMSTGLISFYYTRDKQDRLMGYSSAMNQMGGVISTFLSGILAAVSWRLSFLVYLMGLFSIVLCIAFLPNEKISRNSQKREKGVFKKYYSFAAAIFILMFTFFIYPAEFAIETSKDGIISQHYIAVIMAGMDLIAFFGGLSYVHIKKHFGSGPKFVAPLMFLAGYTALTLLRGWPGAIIGSCLIGFANGLGIPFIISTASRKAGKSAATTVMPLVSMAMYLAQFLTPIILSVITGAVGITSPDHVPYIIACVSAAILILWSFLIKGNEKPRHSVIREN